MLRHIIAIVIALVMPLNSAIAASAPAAPVPTAAVNIPGALVDQVTKTTATATVNKKQGVLGYVLSFHDDKYQYAWPICDPSTLVELDGSKVDPTSFVIGDTLVVSAHPNAASSPQVCIDRVVRQAINRGSSGGECLQNYQIKHQIADSPSPLVIKTAYTFTLTAYSRPTLDCDGQAYGASPITTVVAPNRPFTVSLTRQTSGGTKELLRWSLTTDTNGQADFTYTFTAPSTTYKFLVVPGGNAIAGDVISWDAKVIDPHPSPSPTPMPTTNGQIQLTTAPFVLLLVAILAVAAGFETRYWIKRRREHELPEQEYRRTPRL